MTSSRRVVIAMSGGVDSSVAAALLVQQGYEVIGMMLRLWSEPGAEADNRCCTPDAMAMARRIAGTLDIPFYAVDAQQSFYDTVVTYFIDGYAQGVTPNPCLICNRSIRWEFLLNHALALGAEYLATGHYARLLRDDQGQTQLLRAVDGAKDQSYVLHVLGQDQLAHALFPLGEFTKPQVRQFARDLDLPVAERTESQDLCFLAGADYRSFLARNAPPLQTSGEIRTPRGQVVGQHQGLAFYTIGQRKGLGIASQVPLYVLEKDISQNILVVGEATELGMQALVAGPINWVSGEPPSQSFRAQVKIRYKAHDAWATITLIDNSQAHVRFDEPQRDITPGQSAVFFVGDVCLGGGVIQ
jgi:tRNA-uridine 2-sulfurtransferase